MIEWFAKNSVAVNFLLLSILGVGIYSTLNQVPLEVFPDTELDQVNIQVVQRAATPEDIELGITNRVEDAVAELSYVDELTSRSSEQVSSVTIELRSRTDRQKALNEVKTKIDALSTLPQSAERPVVEIPTFQASVVNLVLYGDFDEKELSIIARKVRDDLVREDGVTIARVEGLRPYEIGIEVAPDVLRSYDLTLESVASAIRGQALDLSAGQVRSAAGDVLLRSQQQAYTYNDYYGVIVKRFADGSVLRLGQIATINDGFDENPVITQFNGKPAANIKVFRVGDESAISVSESVKAFLEKQKGVYPNTLELALWDDNSEVVKERLNTLVTSGWQGAILIAILLSLFLHPTVALWVVVGIPVCFAGALALFPVIGLSINTVSLFAFILVLGVVVDDAIVTGENIYTHRAKGASGIGAAIDGTKEIAVPVMFGVVTTMLAFVPLLMLPSETRTFGLNMGAVVIPVLIFSLIESKLILPNHLSRLNINNQPTHVFGIWLSRAQRFVNSLLDKFVDTVYFPIVKQAVKLRYFSLLLFCSALLICSSILINGWVKVSFMPIIASETAVGTVTFPAGTSFNTTNDAVSRLEQTAFELKAKYTIDKQSVIKNIIAISGASLYNNGSQSGVNAGVSHLGSVMFEVDPELMEIKGLLIEDLVKEWREGVGTILGVDSVVFSAQLFDAGSPIFLQIKGQHVDELKEVSEKIRAKLNSYEGVFDIEDSLQNGKKQLLITLKPEAEIIGLNVQSLTTQVRNAFFGSEAQRIQRGRDDIRVIVRYPKDERDSLNQLENLLITTPDGREARFSDIANISWSVSASNIYHNNQLRTSSIEADVNRELVNAQAVNAELAVFMDELLLSYPDVDYSFDGEEKARAEFMQSFVVGLTAVLFAIFGLLAIVFKSYYQPIIVMSVIPFSAIGAIIGHFVLGVGWSVFSFFGILALVGVVINDSLVLVDWINKRIHTGESVYKLAITAGKARFRAVMLTSLTTFAGLFPILLQTSVGAQFLKPMAISLAFGILFATFLTLILVPCNYLIWEDIRRLKRRVLNQDYESVVIE